MPLDPAAPWRRNSDSGVWSADAVKMPPKLVRFSQIAPGRIVLPLARQLNSGVPVISPATSLRPEGRIPETISAFTPARSSAFTAAGKTFERVVDRTSELVMK